MLKSEKRPENKSTIRFYRSERYHFLADLVLVVRVGIWVSSSVWDLTDILRDGGFMVLVAFLAGLMGASPTDSVGDMVGLSGLFSLSVLSSASSIDTSGVAFAALRPTALLIAGAVVSS